MSVNALIRPTFADLRAEIERRAALETPAEEINTLVDQFLATGGEAPCPWVEYDGTVTWLYRDASAESVSVVGDVIGYEPSKTRMARLPGSDLFALTAQMPLDARIEYAFVVDPGEPGTPGGWLAHYRTDPLNNRQIVEAAPLRSLSILEMPNARPVPELDDPEGDEIAGLAYQVVSSADHTIWARVWVALPQDYEAAERRYPTLYLNSGESYLLSAGVPRMLNALLAQGETTPAIVVFVQRVDRGNASPDGRLDGRFVRFLADELAPWIDARYATSTDPQERVIGGVGVGATLSLYAALERPDAFGQVLAQSPFARSFVKAVPALLARNAARGFRPPRCYIDVGRYEAPARIESVQALCAALLARGAAVSYQDFGGDHSFVGWRTTLPDALRFHFGAPPLYSL